MVTAAPSVRSLAAEVLFQVVFEGRSLNQSLPRAQEKAADSDHGRLQDLSFGACRWWFQLRGELEGYLNKPLRKQDRVIEALLIAGLYELRHTATAPHAVVNETVDACRELKHQPLAGLVNAILRKASRQDPPPPASDSARFAHPDWLVEKLRHNWPEYWEAILEANNQHPPMVLRVNQQRLSRNAYLKQLQGAGIEARACVDAPCGIRLLRPCPVTELPGFDQGVVSVQDEAAQLCTELLAAQPGERVLDACAAPGGKTAALLEACPNLRMLALDRDPARLTRVGQNLQRLGLNAQVQAADASEIEQWWDGQSFQRILLDAPCSGSGVIRRHPDIKLLRRDSDLTALGNTQLQLLEQLWRTLAPRGRLVYATCSVFPQENNRIITRFMRGRDDVRLIPIDADWGIDTGAGRQLFPSAEGPDGFFYALLEKGARAKA